MYEDLPAASDRRGRKGLWYRESDGPLEPLQREGDPAFPLRRLFCGFRRHEPVSVPFDFGPGMG